MVVCLLSLRVLVLGCWFAIHRRGVEEAVVPEEYVGVEEVVHWMQGDCPPYCSPCYVDRGRTNPIRCEIEI